MHPGQRSALSEKSRQFFEPRFGQNFGDVRIHADGQASDAANKIQAQAFTHKKDIYFGSGHYQPDTDKGKTLLAHELTHTIQQQAMSPTQPSPTRPRIFKGDIPQTTELNGRVSSPVMELHAPVIQRVAPAVVGAVIWFGKALAATSIDALIDFAIAAITGMPPPGFWAHLDHFFVNLVPGLGEAKKVKKAAKLFKVIDNIIDIVKTLKKLEVPGATGLLKRMTAESDKFKAFIRAGDLDKARGALGQLIGLLREAQVTSRLQEGGARILSVGKKIKIKKPKLGKVVATEIDVIAEEGGKLVYGQVKAGKGALLTPASNKWDNFARQADETLKAAEETGAKVKYYVDDISKEAREFLEGKGIEVKLSSELLK